jgi:predicted O-linked N-acetylglucosamine transferase (SPINDLY family)
MRIGFLSAYFRNHTIGQLNHGLIKHLSRQDFEVLVLSLGSAGDVLGQRIAEAADHYMALPPGLGPCLQAVANLDLDVLYYPDIGMSALSYTLAFSRLAPVQCATWGHPVTSGLPTIDYFLSSRDLDGDDPSGHYTEQLVRLPRLGVVYERPELPARRQRAAFGLPQDSHLYACPQTLFKFHPEFDSLLHEILARDPAGLLVLIEGKYAHWNALLMRRFRRSMPDVCERIHWLPRLAREDYLGLLTVVDILLDPIHFGGGNTSYEGLALGVPIVTLPSAMLRGRLTYAMYRQMEYLKLVARDTTNYVDLAFRLGTDPDFNQHVRAELAERADVLFNDVAIVGDLAGALMQMAEQHRAKGDG